MAMGSPAVTSSSSWRADAGLVDVKATVQIRIIDQPFPAHHGTRFFQIHPHHDQQVVSGAGPTAAGGAHSPAQLGIVHRTWAHNGQQPVVLAVDDAGNGCAVLVDGAGASLLSGNSSSRIAGESNGRTRRMRKSEVDGMAIRAQSAGRSIRPFAGTPDCRWGTGCLSFGAAPTPLSGHRGLLKKPSSCPLSLTYRQLTRRCCVRAGKCRQRFLAGLLSRCRP